MGMSIFLSSIICIKPLPKTVAAPSFFPSLKCTTAKFSYRCWKINLQNQLFLPFVNPHMMLLLRIKISRAVISLLGMKNICRFADGQKLKSLRPSGCNDHHKNRCGNSQWTAFRGRVDHCYSFSFLIP